jgi:hypothetical protein
MRTNKLVGLLMIFGLFSAQSQAEERRHNKLWRISAAVLGAVTIADMQSSVGRQEANPFWHRRMVNLARAAWPSKGRASAQC